MVRSGQNTTNEITRSVRETQREIGGGGGGAERGGREEQTDRQNTEHV